MEILKITSSHSLTMSITDKRPVGEHSYRVNCHQFMNTLKTWQKHNAVPRQPFGVMTLGFERIWVTEPECAEISTAILASHSPITIG